MPTTGALGSGARTTRSPLSRVFLISRNDGEGSCGGTVQPRPGGPTVASASSLVPIPDGVSATEAAAVGLAMITAWRMLITMARVRPGETALVVAAACSFRTSPIVPQGYQSQWKPTTAFSASRR